MLTLQKERSYTIAEVAEIEQCSTDTIRREIARGNLKAYRIGRLIRIRASDLEKARRPVTNAATLRGGDVDVAH